LPLKAIDPSKPILGYTLKRRIGAGGYGEVWSAEAPGGLPKAVKFVYGYHEEKRAQNELKALNRIRTVRHPFLLSLERIDVVDGQMIVISELADMSLKDRFKECLESGMSGIPRSELLEYMRESAGALDFISEEFKLQHLDVKPENLLLVSGHIKVADFGLVKDIHDGTQSMMSGLTPAYAPPELFDGRPSKASDQYSLAIMFQEMLTGLRPFDGVTAAQLASQHMNERPYLRPLPREDQATIAKALSKDPDSRFPSCTAMVDALSQERTRAATPRPRQRTKLREARRKRRGKSDSTQSLQFSSATRHFAINATQLIKLPRLDYDASYATCRPTLFLGLGSTGTRILQQIKKRLQERHGDPRLLPAIRLLAIDTDSNDVTHAGGDEAHSLEASELLPIPLRKPKDYRDEGSSMHLDWLSRRWIYNIPKSLRTEGIRPLGRLAMATHIEELTIRLRRVMAELVQTENLALTADTLELNPDTVPRVVIVGAVSGGTCSGTAIDFAYITRAILRELGITNEDVLGVFTHSATSWDSTRELSIANTLAFLNELYHFSCVEEYPGDQSCGIPASIDNTTTFASTYLIPLGDDLSHHEYEGSIDAIAEYLYLASASTCGTYLDQCRRAEEESEGLPLRTLGICQTSAGTGDLVLHAARLLGEHIIQDWTKEAPAEQLETQSVANEILDQHGYSMDAIVELIQATTNQILGNALTFTMHGLLQRFDPGDPAQTARSIRQFVGSMFGFDLPDGTGSTELTKAIDKLWQHAKTQRAPKIAEAMLAIVDLPGPRMTGASQVAATMRNVLKTRKAQLEQNLVTLKHKLKQRLAALSEDGNPIEEDPKQYFQDWAVELVQRFTVESAIRMNSAIVPATTTVSEAINELKSHLSYITSRRCSEENATAFEPDESESSLAAEFHRRVVVSLRDRLPQMAKQVEQLFQFNLLDKNGGMRAVLQNHDLRDNFREQFEEATRASIVELLKEIPLDIFDETLTPEQFAAWIEQEAKPLLTECGGAVRSMYAYPRRAQAANDLLASLEAKLGHAPSVIPATVGEIVTCIEAERVPLDTVTMRLLKDRPDSIEYASRLHTRTDIVWTHISSMR